MADWPDLNAVKQQVGIDNDAKDALLQTALAAAIEGVVADCGGAPVEVEFGPGGEPTVSLTDPSATDPVLIPVSGKLARAALHRAVTVYKGPDAWAGVASVFDSGGMYVARWDHIYMSLVRGGRQRFSLS